MKDWIGETFKLFEKNGIDINFSLCKYNLNDETIEYTHVSHAEFDAIGCFFHYLKQNGYTQLPPAFKANTTFTLKFFQKIPLFLYFIYFLLIKKINPISWKNYDIAKQFNKNYSGVSWFMLNPQETQQVEAYCTKNKLSLNSLLLFHLNKIVASRLQKDNQKNHWAITVNMRGLVPNISDTANCFSILPIEIKSTTTIEALKNNISAQLKNKKYWSYWWLLTLPRYLSTQTCQFILKQQIKKRKLLMTGIYSNIGTWDLPEKNNEEIFFGAPVPSMFQPIATGVIKFNGRLILAMQIHPMICNNRAEIDTYCTDWGTQILHTIQQA